MRAILRMKSSSSSHTLNSKFEKFPVMMKMFRLSSCLSIFSSNVRVVTLAPKLGVI